MLGCIVLVHISRALCVVHIVLCCWCSLFRIELAAVNSAGQGNFAMIVERTLTFGEYLTC